MSDNSDEQKEFYEAIQSLNHRANMLATCHSVMSDRYRKLNTIIVSAILVLSTFSVGVAFISDQFVQRTIGISPDALKWINGVLSILTFAASLLLSQWHLADKAAEHRSAVRHYFKIRNWAKTLLDSESVITRNELENLRVEYENTDSLPKIPESRFLKLKKYHLQKVAISKALDKTPHTSIRQIKRQLREQESE